MQKPQKLEGLCGNTYEKPPLSCEVPNLHVNKLLEFQYETMLP